MRPRRGMLCRSTLQQPDAPGTIVSLTERKSRLALLRKVERNTAQAEGGAVIDLLKSLTAQTHTITADNGREFADHERIASALCADVYFAHPYSSWERATNENM